MFSTLELLHKVRPAAIRGGYHVSDPGQKELAEVPGEPDLEHIFLPLSDRRLASPQYSLVPYNQPESLLDASLASLHLPGKNMTTLLDGKWP